MFIILNNTNNVFTFYVGQFEYPLYSDVNSGVFVKLAFLNYSLYIYICVCVRVCACVYSDPNHFSPFEPLLPQPPRFG